MRNKVLLPFFLFCSICCWFNLPAQAQTKIISGVVVDDKNEPVQGASVSVKDGTASTVTDAKGNFSLSIPDANITLLITHVGFDAKEVVPGNQAKLSVNLTPAAANMQAVVITALGFEAKKDRIGYASSKHFGRSAWQFGRSRIGGCIGGKKPPVFGYPVPQATRVLPRRFLFAGKAPLPAVQIRSLLLMEYP